MNGVEEIVSTAGSRVIDTSLMGIFTQASFMVKFVVILLIGCSIWSWAIVFAKLICIKKLKGRADKFEEAFWNCGSVEVLFDNLNSRGDDPFSTVFVAGMQEWRRAKARVRTAIGSISLNERIGRVMRVTADREVGYLEYHIGFLASVGSTAPFVGVFGTVMGIINTFESMRGDQNISLVSVAPGIAEALFATALGLVVTIPAVVAYNKILSEINRYQSRLDAFIDEFSSIISRQIEDSGV
ncbi:MAG: protein TolQ [Holosporaceae bacterium]|jgi:biopolymer transport protein TolQ|nr:protein TolQ [Holosporaceae bacterium]